MKTCFEMCLLLVFYKVVQIVAIEHDMQRMGYIRCDPDPQEGTKRSAYFKLSISRSTINYTSLYVQRRIAEKRSMHATSIHIAAGNYIVLLVLLIRILQSSGVSGIIFYFSVPLCHAHYAIPFHFPYPITRFYFYISVILHACKQMRVSMIIILIIIILLVARIVCLP